MNSTNATTTSKITPFQFEKKPVRIQIDDLGNPWFYANDVCAALGYVNPHKAVDDHVDLDDLTKREVIDSLGRSQPTNHINESGLYALIFGSTKPEAKRFKKWVTSEVLPSIRKTGQYQHQAAPPQISDQSISISFEGAPIRVVLDQGEPWFNIVDVQRAMGYKQYQTLILTRIETKDIRKFLTKTNSGNRQVNYTNKRGLTEMIAWTTLPSAGRFGVWLSDSE